MSLLRVGYLQGLFRWKPSPESMELPGEAETREFYSSEYLRDAWSAAMCLDLQWGADARDWVDDVHDNGLAVAVEQCCHDGRLMSCELRAAPATIRPGDRLPGRARSSSIAERQGRRRAPLPLVAGPNRTREAHRLSGSRPSTSPDVHRRFSDSWRQYYAINEPRASSRLTGQFG